MKEPRQAVIDAMRKELTFLDMDLECVWPAAPDETLVRKRVEKVADFLKLLQNSPRSYEFVGQPNPGAGIPVDATTGYGNCVFEGGGFIVKTFDISQSPIYDEKRHGHIRLEKFS